MRSVNRNHWSDSENQLLIEKGPTEACKLLGRSYTACNQQHAKLAKRGLTIHKKGRRKKVSEAQENFDKLKDKLTWYTKDRVEASEELPTQKPAFIPLTDDMYGQDPAYPYAQWPDRVSSEELPVAVYTQKEMPYTAFKRILDKVANWF